MTTLDRDGVAIYFEDHGSGPPVLLSHAFGASSRMSAAQVEALKPHFRVITWDMRGHGQSDSPAAASAYTEEATIKDMNALLGHLGITAAVLGGLSLGGYMSLAFYRQYPETVRALMLCDTGPGFRDPVARERWNAAAEERAAAFETRGLSAWANPMTESLDILRPLALPMPARGMLAKYNAHVIESLEQVGVPALVLVGENDKPLLGADYLVARIQAAQKVVIPGAGHLANLDQPGKFNEAVLAFLRGL